MPVSKGVFSPKSEDRESESHSSKLLSFHGDHSNVVFDGVDGAQFTYTSH